MNAWWWLPIGLAAWFAIAVAVGLWFGPVLRSCSQAREAVDQHTAEILAMPQEPPRPWRQTPWISDSFQVSGRRTSESAG